MGDHTSKLKLHRASNSRGRIASLVRKKIDFCLYSVSHNRLQSIQVCVAHADLSTLFVIVAKIRRLGHRIISHSQSPHSHTSTAWCVVGLCRMHRAIAFVDLQQRGMEDESIDHGTQLCVGTRRAYKRFRIVHELVFASVVLPTDAAFPILCVPTQSF